MVPLDVTLTHYQTSASPAPSPARETCTNSTARAYSCAGGGPARARFLPSSVLTFAGWLSRLLEVEGGVFFLLIFAQYSSAARSFCYVGGVGAWRAVLDWLIVRWRAPPRQGKAKVSTRASTHVIRHYDRRDAEPRPRWPRVNAPSPAARVDEETMYQQRTTHVSVATGDVVRDRLLCPRWLRGRTRRNTRHVLAVKIDVRRSGYLASASSI